MAYYIVIDDVEYKRLYGSNTPRPVDRNGVPATVAVFNGNWNKQRVSLSPRWFKYAKKINSTPDLKGYNYQFTKSGIFAPAIGWHNVGKGNIIEQLAFAGNIVSVKRIEGNRAYVHCFYNTDKPPVEIIRSTPGNLHPLVHLLSTQFYNKLDITTNGRCPQTFLIATSRKQELWIDIRNLRKVG
jgi:hypothetical protein